MRLKKGVNIPNLLVVVTPQKSRPLSYIYIQGIEISHDESAVILDYRVTAELDAASN